MEITKALRKIPFLPVFILISVFFAGSSVQGAEDSLTLFLGSDQESYYAPGIEEFRQKYPEVELTVEVYSLNELVFSQEKIKTQLMAGEGPDLLLLDSMGTDDVEKLLKSGVFAPLDTFMTEENGWDASQYVMPAIEAGRFDGIQYVMPLNYRMPMFLSSKEALEEIGFSMEAAQDTGSLLQEISSLYEKEHKDRILLEASGLMPFPQFLEGKFLDYEAGTIGLDSQALQNACEAFKNLHLETQETSLGEGGYYGSGVKILEREGYLTLPTGIDTMLMPASAIAVQETPVLLPLRAGKEGAVAEVAQYAGIRANSENPEAAWKMLEILLGEEMQKAAAQVSITMPVLISAQEAKKETAVSQTLEDAKAEGVQAVSPGEDFLEEYWNILRNPEKVIFANSVCMLEFYSRMLPFYEGQGTYEDCIQDFESYIQIYLSE